MRYEKMVELEARAAAKVEEWQRRVIRAASLLERWRLELARRRRNLERAEADVQAGKLCSWCALPPGRCKCMPELDDPAAGREG